MIIYIGDRHRLRRYDKRNWVLEELRAPDQRSPLTKSTEARWFSRERYFQTISSGLLWVCEHEALEDPLEADLRSALDRVQEIADSLALRADGLKGGDDGE